MSMDCDQSVKEFGPDLGPDFLQRLSAVDTSRQRVSSHSSYSGFIQASLSKIQGLFKDF